MMPSTAQPKWIPVSRILIAAALLISSGSYFLHDFWVTMAAGQLQITGKYRQLFVAYANGPHAQTFYLHLCTELLLSSAAVVGGLALVASLLVKASRKRNAIWSAFGLSNGSVADHILWIAAAAATAFVLRMLISQVLNGS